MICANKVLPVYRAVSRRKPGRLRLHAAQVDTTRFCQKTIKNQGVQNRTHSVNRTAVKSHI